MPMITTKSSWEQLRRPQLSSNIPPPEPFQRHDWLFSLRKEPRIFLLFWVGRRSPELFDLLLRWIGRRREEPQICLLFWLGRYAPWLFELILDWRRHWARRLKR